MTYLEKENLILNKLCETNYALFDNDKNDALKYITTQLLTITDYRNTSIKTNISSSLRNNSDTKSDKNVSDTNYNAFQKAIYSIESLNKICQKLGIELFMDIDTNDTSAVEKAINDFTTELFSKGINK